MIRLQPNAAGLSRYHFVCENGGSLSPGGRWFEEARKLAEAIDWTIEGEDGLCPTCADGGQCERAPAYVAPPPPVAIERPVPPVSDRKKAAVEGARKRMESRYERECPACGHRYGKVDKTAQDCPDCGTIGVPVKVSTETKA